MIIFLHGSRLANGLQTKKTQLYAIVSSVKTKNNLSEISSI